MKIQSIASEAYYKTASANNVNVKSQKVMERPNITFGGNYSQEFKKALKMPIREHYDTCIILNTLRKALKDENIVISQAYRRFMNYTAGEFISYGAKERNLIIAETVEMNNKPLMSIDGDGYLRVRDLNSTGELIFFYKIKRLFRIA